MAGLGGTESSFASLLRTWKKRAGSDGPPPPAAGRPAAGQRGALLRASTARGASPGLRAGPVNDTGGAEAPAPPGAGAEAEAPQLRAEVDRLSATTEVLVRLVRELTFHRAYQVPAEELRARGVQLSDSYRAAVNVLGACVDVEVRGLRAGPGLLFSLPVWARPVDPTPAPVEAVRVLPGGEGVPRWQYVTTGRLLIGPDGAVQYEHLLSVEAAELWGEGAFDAERGLSTRACFPRRLGSEATTAGGSPDPPGPPCL